MVQEKKIVFNRGLRNHESVNGTSLAFDDDVAQKILEDIRREFGLDYEKQSYITKRKMERFALKNELHSFEELHRRLTSSALLKEGLVNLLTVGETYFYREFPQIAKIVSLIEKERVKKILCAPCSSGEEVYSILIEASMRGIEISDVSICGIDINTEALAKAAEGLYTSRSLSKLSDKTVARYFKPEEKGFRISATLKGSATFVHCNVFDPSPLSHQRFDAVFSRNMLIYFSDGDKRRALQSIHRLLRPGGYLFLGHADIAFTPEGFDTVRENGVTFYRKKV